jgi:hypothetical protein
LQSLPLRIHKRHFVLGFRNRIDIIELIVDVRDRGAFQTKQYHFSFSTLDVKTSWLTLFNGLQQQQSSVSMSTTTFSNSAPDLFGSKQIRNTTPALSAKVIPESSVARKTAAELYRLGKTEHSIVIDRELLVKKGMARSLSSLSKGIDSTISETICGFPSTDTLFNPNKNADGSEASLATLALNPFSSNPDVEKDTESDIILSKERATMKLNDIGRGSDKRCVLPSTHGTENEKCTTSTSHIDQGATETEKQTNEDEPLVFAVAPGMKKNLRIMAHSNTPSSTSSNLALDKTDDVETRAKTPLASTFATLGQIQPALHTLISRTTSGKQQDASKLNKANSRRDKNKHTKDEEVHRYQYVTSEYSAPVDTHGKTAHRFAAIVSSFCHSFKNPKPNMRQKAKRPRYYWGCPLSPPPQISVN